MTKMKWPNRGGGGMSGSVGFGHGDDDAYCPPVQQIPTSYEEIARTRHLYADCRCRMSDIDTWHPTGGTGCAGLDAEISKLRKADRSQPTANVSPNGVRLTPTEAVFYDFNDSGVSLIHDWSLAESNLPFVVLSTEGGFRYEYWIRNISESVRAHPFHPRYPDARMVSAYWRSEAERWSLACCTDERFVKALALIRHRHFPDANRQALGIELFTHMFAVHDVGGVISEPRRRAILTSLLSLQRRGIEKEAALEMHRQLKRSADTQDWWRPRD